MEFQKKPGEDLVFSLNGTPVVTIKDSPSQPPPPDPDPNPVTDAKVEASIVSGKVQIKGIDGTNPYFISNDFAADTPELFLLLLQQDKGKGNLKGIEIHNTLDKDWPFERTQGHWSNLAHEGRSLKNYPFPVKGSTRALVRPSNGNLLSTSPEVTDGATKLRDEARKCTAAKPLVVFMGGQTSTVASAFLMDKTIADKMVCLHINGFYDNKKIAHGYNTTDVVASEICARYLKYVVINVKFPENRKYWYDGKNLGLSLAQINALPAHVTKTMLVNWYNKSFKTEGMADAPGFLWFHNNGLWKNFVKKRVDGSITTGNDYDFIFITDHDWTGYGATLINEFKKLLSDVPPVVVPPDDEKPPQDPPPPTGGLTTGFEEAIRTAGEGRTIVIAPGQRFDLPAMDVKNLIVEGNGSTITPRLAGGESTGTRKGIFHLTGGKLELRNVVFDGQNKGYAAATGGNGSDVKLSKVKTRDFNFTGTWFQNVSNLNVLDCEFHNTGWADSRYMTGALMLNNITNYLVTRCKFTSDKNSKGTGIESNLLGGNDSKLINGRITHNQFSLSRHNPWNGGASQNFSMELTNVSVFGLDVSYNEINNEISFALGRRSNGNKTLVHHNTGNLGGDYFFIEAMLDDLEVYENNISNVRMFSVNFQKNGVWRNHVYRKNTVTNPAPALSWGSCWIMIGGDGAQNYLVEGNNFPAVRKEVVQFQGVRGGVTVR